MTQASPQSKGLSDDDFIKGGGRVGLTDQEFFGGGGTVQQSSSNTHGTTGSWGNPKTLNERLGESVDQFQSAHPIIAAPLTFLESTGKAVIGAGTGLYHAATDPLTPDEQTRYGHGAPPILLPVERMLAGNIANANKVSQDIANRRAQDRKNHSLGPMLGQTASPRQVLSILFPPSENIIDQAAKGGVRNVTEALGTTFGYAGTPALTEGLSSIPREALKSRIASVGAHTPITEDAANAMSRISRPAGEGAPQPDAAATRPFILESAKRSGFNPAIDMAVNVTKGKTGDPFGDLYRGGDVIKTRRVAINLGVKYDPANPTPIPVMLADHAVKVAHEPIDASIQAFAKHPIPQIQSNIATRLYAMSVDELKTNTALANQYYRLAEDVQKNGGTVEGLNDLKKNSNLKSAKIMKKGPSGQMEAAITGAGAHADFAAMVRQELYPYLENRGAPNLTEAGRTEAKVINYRDGLRQEWANAVNANADAMKQSTAGYIAKGPNNKIVSPTFASMAERGLETVGSRFGLGQSRYPLAEFNRDFVRGIGGTRGFQLNAPTVNPVPVRGLLPPAPTQLPAIPPSPSGSMVPSPQGPHSVVIPGQFPIASTFRYERAPLPPSAKLLPEAGATSVKVTPPPPESFSEALARTQTPQSALMRETMGKGPYDKQASPATAEEYIKTKGGTKMPNSKKYEAKKPSPPKSKK